MNRDDTGAIETLLKRLVLQRNMTHPEEVTALRRRANLMGVDGFSVDVRQFDRWLAGKVKCPHPPQRRVLEAEYGFPTSLLMGPTDQVNLSAWAPQSIGSSCKLQRCDHLLGWLSVHADVAIEQLYALVADAASSEEPDADRVAIAHAQASLTRQDIARSLLHLYGAASNFYRAEVDGDPLVLSVVSEPAWTTLNVTLGVSHEHNRLQSESELAALPPDVFWAAVQRLGEVERGNARLYDNPLYRLEDFSVEGDTLSAGFSVTSFLAYALSTDLMEQELFAALATTGSSEMHLPIRSRYLPDLKSVRSLAERVCAGGVGCLVAIADDDDYRLIIQERSSKVLNAAGRLAVVPKAFHQPLGDRRDVALGSTLRREFEEELLGRAEVDQASADALRRIAPGHPSGMTEPMRWLEAHPDSFITKCCGFGFNMLSGNYEVAALAIIDDPQWWALFGHQLEGNWEIGRTHCYSSRDREGLQHLIKDSRWSNEGLFTLLQGLQLLARHNPERIDFPRIEVAA